MKRRLIRVTLLYYILYLMEFQKLISPSSDIILYKISNNCQRPLTIKWRKRYVHTGSNLFGYKRYYKPSKDLRLLVLKV